MRRWFCLFLILVSFGGYAQIASSELRSQFSLRKEEIPAGFVLEPVDDEEFAALGITSNPIILDPNNKLIDGLYSHPDRSVIRQAQLEIYIKGQDRELGVSTIEYQSVSAREHEQMKIRTQGDGRYFWKDRYLVIIWSDADSFRQQVDQLAEKLQQRLNLTEFTPEPEDIPVVKALPAESVE